MKWWKYFAFTSAYAGLGAFVEFLLALAGWMRYGSDTACYITSLSTFSVGSAIVAIIMYLIEELMK